MNEHDEEYEYEEELYRVADVENCKDKARESDYYKENLERIVSILRALLKYDGEHLWFKGTNELFVKTKDYEWLCSIIKGELELI